VRIGTKADNPIEAVIARLNIAPRPLLETQIATRASGTSTSGGCERWRAGSRMS
jgi:hypothetical protein